MLIETYGQLSAERPFRILKITEKTEPYLLQNSPIGDNSCSATVTPAENLSEAQRNGYGEAVISEVFVNDRVLTVKDANSNTYKIDADQHPILSKLSTLQLLAFRLNSAGSGMHWHDLDLDLDLDGLLLRGEQSTESFRKERGSALATWLDKYPSILAQLSTEDRATAMMVSKGNADLLLSLVDRLAKLASMSADALLDELALIQRPPTPL